MLGEAGRSSGGGDTRAESSRMTKSQSSGEKEGALDQGRCRCKGKKLRERATCVRGGSSSFWLFVVLRRHGERRDWRGPPLGSHKNTGHWSKLRTEGTAGICMQAPGKKHWV